MPRRQVFNIHISDVSAFKACRQRWDYSSTIRKSLAPRAIYAPFLVGSGVHKALELRFKFGTPLQDGVTHFLAKELKPLKADPVLWEGVKAQVEENETLIRGMLAHYHEWQKASNTPLADRAFEFVSTEAPFNIKLWGNSRKQINYAGTFDGVVRHLETGKYYLWEVKTTRSITERVKQLDFDPQTTGYILGAQRALGLEIEGVIYTLLRKSLPNTPQPLKSGDRLSKAIKEGKYYNTSAEWYIKTVREFHPTATKAGIMDFYGDVISVLAEAGNSYFSRVVIKRSQAELARFESELLEVSKAMIDPRVPVYRGEGQHCNYCTFRNPCLLLHREGPEAEATNLAANYIYHNRHEAQEEE